MQRPEFVAILSPLVLAMRADFDTPTWAAYFQALQDVPARLLQATVDAMLREARAFFPKAGELRAGAERARQALIAAHPYDGCIECEYSKGWRPVLVAGQATVERCPCRQRHLEKLADLGVGDQPLALPPARFSDWTQAGDDAA